MNGLRDERKHLACLAVTTCVHADRLRARAARAQALGYYTVSIGTDEAEAIAQRLDTCAEALERAHRVLLREGA